MGDGVIAEDWTGPMVVVYVPIIVDVAFDWTVVD